MLGGCGSVTAGLSRGETMRVRITIAIGLLCAVSSSQAAVAQRSFTGPHVGGAVAAVDHHFVLEETEVASGNTRRFNVTRWGPGGQLFAGYDMAVAPRLIVGVEGAFDFGGKAAVERNRFYTFGISPRHGFAVTARAGVVVVPSILLYAGAGYGGHDYDLVGSSPAPGSDDLSYNRSFVLRGGSEYRLGRHVAVRAEFEHLDGTRNTFMLGIPIRF